MEFIRALETDHIFRFKCLNMNSFFIRWDFAHDKHSNHYSFLTRLQSFKRYAAIGEGNSSSISFDVIQSCHETMNNDEVNGFTRLLVIIRFTFAFILMNAVAISIGNWISE